MSIVIRTSPVQDRMSWNSVKRTDVKSNALKVSILEAASFL